MPGKTTAYIISAPGTVTLTASTTPFSFNAFGQPQPNNDITVSVGGRSVTITAETGYVH
jgi:hypothetical protein